MLNPLFLLLPFVLQTLCMAVDELHFHRQRGLPRWERLGHPLDTLTVVACYTWLFFTLPSTLSITVYVGLSVFSSVFITKDEWVHNRYCGPAECWLHTLLFILHPLALLSAGLLWPAWHGQSLAFIRYTGFEGKFLLGNALLTLAFGGYQFIYWNFIWSSATPPQQVRLTTSSTTN